MEFGKNANLFAVTYASKDGTSLYDWIPFPTGDSLGKMILNHNQKCMDTYKKMKWGDPYIRTMAEGVYLVPSHISKISDWQISDFSEKNYILIDSNMVNHESDIKRMVQIMPHGKWYYLLFVGNTKEIEFLANEFDYGSVVPCGTLQNQAQFEAFLSDHCHSYGQFLWEALKARSIDPTTRTRGISGYVKQSIAMQGIPSIAINVQAFSNFVDINDEQKKDLAYNISKNGYTELTRLMDGLSISEDQVQYLSLKFSNDSKYLSLAKENFREIPVGRYFELMNEANKEIGIFAGKQPRQAALKAANRGITDIRLRERGTKNVHLFTGERVQVDKPKDAPAWMPDKIWKPNVKKMGIEKIK